MTHETKDHNLRRHIVVEPEEDRSIPPVGARVRIIASEKPLDPAWPTEHVGKEGTYVGLFENDPNVSYPFGVDVDGVGPRYYRRDEIELLSTPAERGSE